jgi:hypothetical protein
MASNLVVEDGTGLANASSYTSAADIRAYATARGVTLAASDGAGDLIVDQLAIKAMDYIEANRSYFWGWRFAPTVQRLEFPREGVPEPDGAYVGTTTIQNGYENIIAGGVIAYRDPAPLPRELIEAQCRLVIKIKDGVDLMPTQVSGKFLKRQKIGPIEREFSEAIGIFVTPRMPDIDALLAPLLRPRGPMRSYRG